MADVCALKQLEESSQKVQSQEHNKKKSFLSRHEETEPFPDEVLETLCLIRNSSLDLKRLLSPPQNNDIKTNDKPFETRKHEKKFLQSSKERNHTPESKRLDRELEKMLK